MREAGAFCCGLFVATPQDAPFTLHSSLFTLLFTALAAAAINAQCLANDLTIETKIGVDYTNATILVTVPDSLVTNSCASLNATVRALSDSSVVATKEVANITSGCVERVELQRPLTPKETYICEARVTTLGVAVATKREPFFAGRRQHAFDLDCMNSLTNDTWTTLAPNATASVTGSVLCVETALTVEEAVDAAELPLGEEAQGMLALVAASDAYSEPTWQAYANGCWRTLSGGETSFGTYRIRAEFDYSKSVRRVRYSLAKADGDWAVLTLDGSMWIVGGISDATAIEAITTGGNSSLTALTAEAGDAFVAATGGKRYETIAQALAEETNPLDVRMLWDVTANESLKVVKDTILDLSGKHLSGEGKLATTGGATLTITNSTSVVGGYALPIDEDSTMVIRGGKWPANGNTARLGDGYRFIPLACAETLNGATYRHEARATEALAENAVICPLLQNDEEVSGVLLSNDFISQHVPQEEQTSEKLVEALNGPRSDGNGLPLLQSYVLGLDPDDPESLPEVSSQDVSSNLVGLALGNINVRTEAGVKVSFSLTTSPTASFENGSTTLAQPTSAFYANVPAADEPPARYYRINILFGDNQ